MALTIQEVLIFLRDRSMMETPDFDLTQVAPSAFEFTPAEVQTAMVRCAREFNSMPPLVSTVSPTALPTGTNLFLNGTVWQLLVSRSLEEMRRDIPYVAGDVTVNYAERQVQHMQQAAKYFYQEFRREALNYKKTINQGLFAGRIG